MLYPSNKARRTWSDRRILTLVALGTLIVSVIWRLPDEASFLGQRLGEVLLALTLALAMTYVLRPLVLGVMKFPSLRHHPHGRSWATILVFLGIGVSMYVMYLVAFKPVANDIKSQVPATAEGRKAMVQQWRVTLREKLEPYRDFLPAEVVDNPNFLPERVAGMSHGVFDWLKHQSSHVGFIVELLLVPVLSFYFLADGPAIRRECSLLLPMAWRPRLSRMAHHFDTVLDGYVRGQVWMCIIAWVLVTITLYILRVPHAMTLGLIAGVTRAVPVIGPLLGAIPLLFACLAYTSVQTATILLLAFILMHFLESKVLLPKIVGHHVDLHPVSVIVALLLGMEFFGFIGVFLAVPIAAVLKIVLTEFHENQRLQLESALALPGNNGTNALANGSNGVHAAYDEEPAELN